jgi:hypothetical protein
LGLPFPGASADAVSVALTRALSVPPGMLTWWQRIAPFSGE